MNRLQIDVHDVGYLLVAEAVKETQVDGFPLTDRQQRQRLMKFIFMGGRFLIVD